MAVAAAPTFLPFRLPRPSSSLAVRVRRFLFTSSSRGYVSLHSIRRGGGGQVNAAISTVGRTTSTTPSNENKLLLEVMDLTAVVAETKQEILKGVNLTVYEGEVHAVMGKNGSGKSTFAKVLFGHPDYEVTGGSMVFKGENLLDMEPEERSLEIPGVSNSDFLNTAYNARRRKLNEPELSPIEFWAYVYPKLDLLNMKADFLNRNVNEGFSGGERKRNEILQLAVLGADLAILDEIDSGLDVDALRDVAKAVNGLLTPNNFVLMITHYLRLLLFIQPKYIHVMVLSYDHWIPNVHIVYLRYCWSSGGWKNH